MACMLTTAASYWGIVILPLASFIAYQCPSRTSYFQLPLPSSENNRRAFMTAYVHAHLDEDRSIWNKIYKFIRAHEHKQTTLTHWQCYSSIKIDRATNFLHCGLTKVWPWTCAFSSSLHITLTMGRHTSIFYTALIKLRNYGHDVLHISYRVITFSVTQKRVQTSNEKLLLFF